MCESQEKNVLSRQGPSESNCSLNVGISCWNAVPIGSIPNALRIRPQTMLPLLTLVVYANNNTRRFPTFDPLNQTQQDVTVCLTGRIRDSPDIPSARSARTVPHTRDHEKTVKVINRMIRLCKNATSVRIQSGTLCVCGHGYALTYLKLGSWTIRGYGIPLKGQMVSPVTGKNTRISEYRGTKDSTG